MPRRVQPPPEAEKWPGPAIGDREALRDLLTRAKESPALRQQLVTNPLGTCLLYGVGLSTDSIKVWLGYDPDTIDDDALLDVLINLLHPRQCSGG
jgi:hypothetical protein